jgi:hypothetical protein
MVEVCFRFSPDEETNSHDIGFFAAISSGIFSKQSESTASSSRGGILRCAHEPSPPWEDHVVSSRRMSSYGFLALLSLGKGR